MGAPENDGFLEYKGIFQEAKGYLGPSREFTYPTLKHAWDMLVPRSV